MTPIDYFAWFVLIVIVISAIAIFVALARLPGEIASQRGHPQSEAINVAGWLGALLTLGVVWVLAMVWAFAKPRNGASDSQRREIEALSARIVELEARLEGAKGTRS